VIGLNRVPDLPDGMGGVNMAQFFSPYIVVRHINKPPKRAQTPGPGNAPTDFLKHFAIQCL
tara:strand:- start:2502 stop:2684 length:183 start_codon:yes stop_codon:yes gene_type:complete